MNVPSLSLLGKSQASTYTRVVQTTGSVLYDGIGNLLDFLNITASNAINCMHADTASFSIVNFVTQSVATSSISAISSSWASQSLSASVLFNDNAYVTLEGTSKFKSILGYDGLNSHWYLDADGTSGFADDTLVVGTTEVSFMGDSAFVDLAGNITAPQFIGTASWSTNAVSSSFSNKAFAAVSASWASQSLSSSFSKKATSSDIASLASEAKTYQSPNVSAYNIDAFGNAEFNTLGLGVSVGTYITNTTILTNQITADGITSSLNGTSSWANNSISASWARQSLSASALFNANANIKLDGTSKLKSIYGYDGLNNHWYINTDGTSGFADDVLVVSTLGISFMGDASSINLTGDFIGTASWSNNAISSSFSNKAFASVSSSWASRSLSSSFSNKAFASVSSSWASQSFSSSYAITASYASNAGTSAPVDVWPLVKSSAQTHSVDFNIPYLEISGSVNNLVDLCFTSSANIQAVKNAVIYVSASVSRNIVWSNEWQFLTISPPSNITSTEALIASFTALGPNNTDIIASVALTV